MSQIPKTLPAYALKVCRGAESCPHAVLAADLSANIDAIIAASAWPDLLASTTVRRHHQFRLAVSSCPNGCSQPHIADFGLIATARMRLLPDQCTACGNCVPVCVEKALHLGEHLELLQDRCLGCAACIRACPTAALEVSERGYRVMLGGKLGRHPRLAHELGWFTRDQALQVLSKTLDVFVRHYQPGLRLGELVRAMGQDAFDRLVRPD